MAMLQCFSTPIWTFDADQRETLDKEFLDLIEQMRSSATSDAESVSRSNQGGGWHSNFIDVTRTPVFQSELNRVMSQIAGQIGIRKNAQLMMGGSWININYRGSSNSQHTHPDSMFSGTYYLKTPPNSGRFVAHDPRPQANIISLPVDRHTPLTSPQYNHAPKAGQFLIFPSWMPHSVEANQSDEERISIAFNLFYHDPAQS